MPDFSLPDFSFSEIALPFYLLPFRLVITQAVLILVAIALESMVFNRILGYPPRKSVEYATSLNLFSLFVGWFLFLNLIGTFPLPAVIKLDLISFILFDRWSNSTFIWSITAGLTTFFGTFLIEFIAFRALQRLRNEAEAIEKQLGLTQRRPRYSASRYPGLFSLNEGGQGDPLYAILLANAASYSAVVILLGVLRLWPDTVPPFPLLPLSVLNVF